MPSRLVKSESPVQKSAKIQIPTQLLEPVELEQYKILIEQKAYNGCEADKIKLQEYQRFFEKKEYITGARLADLKDPVTIEGVSKNASWTQMVDKPILTKIFNKETLNEKEVEVQNFLTDRANVITHCYDGYPNRLHHFSVFVRVMLFKFKKPSSEIKNSYLQPRLEI
jgi:predicted amidohydrolase